MPRKTIKSIPMRVPRGPVTWEALSSFLDTFQREVLAQFDIRNPTAFPSAAVADPTTGIVRLGSLARPTDRDVGVPALTDLIGDDGRELNQTFRRQLGVGNISSVQSVNPLSAVTGSTPSTAVISVAAHDVHIGHTSVSYNSGSVSGLEFATTYWIYADDADFDGGAVTYYATTTATDIADSLVRYWVGAITTPALQTSATISGITQDNPAVVTANGHPFSDGDVIEITAVVGMTEVNGNQYTVANSDANTFELSGVDSTGYTAYSSGGIATLITGTQTTIGVGGAGGGGAEPGIG